LPLFTPPLIRRRCYAYFAQRHAIARAAATHARCSPLLLLTPYAAATLMLISIFSSPLIARCFRFLLIIAASGSPQNV